MADCRKKRLLPLSYLPESAQSLVNQVVQELDAAIRRTVKLVRCRWALPAPHNPFSYRRSDYSIDGTVWHTLPTNFSISMEGISSFALAEKQRDLLTELLSSNAEEPLAHELLREAADLRHIAPRSALLIGVSALEVGFKALVADLVPNAGWLVEEAPTPRWSGCSSCTCRSCQLDSLSEEGCYPRLPRYSTNSRRRSTPGTRSRMPVVSP